MGWGPDEFLGGGEEGGARLVSTGQMAEINRPESLINKGQEGKTEETDSPQLWAMSEEGGFDLYTFSYNVICVLKQISLCLFFQKKSTNSYLSLIVTLQVLIEFLKTK